MPFGRTQFFTDNGFNVGRFLVGVDQITDIQLSGKCHHHPQTMAKCYVEQGARRHGMRNSDCVEFLGSHKGEVLFGVRRIVVFAFVGVGPKSAETDAGAPI